MSESKPYDVIEHLGHCPECGRHEWQGLTDEDMEKLRDQFEDWSYPASLVSAIEAKLKEKNCI